MVAIPPSFSFVTGGVMDYLKSINILGITTLLQGLLTMGLSWMIFYRSETAQLTSNDQQAKLLRQLSESNMNRLRGIKNRITDVGANNASFAHATSSMLADLDATIQDYLDIYNYCVDMENRMWLDRWRCAQDISLQLKERQGRAADPSHLLNLTLSGVFALMEQAGAKPLVDF